MKKVLMNFTEKTLSQVEDIKNATGIEQRTRVVVSSIDIVHEITKSINDGGKVFIEKENGEKYYLKIIGL